MVSRLTDIRRYSTNVPDIAMSFSDRRFAYGPFAPHYIPRQYIEGYFSHHKTDALLVLSTTVEDVSRVSDDDSQWRLTLRRYDPIQHLDVWWQDTFDAVILANGHYSVPYVRLPPSPPPKKHSQTLAILRYYTVHPPTLLRAPQIPHVSGLQEYMAAFPNKVTHSKSYRTPHLYAGQKVLVIGNSASGHDIAAELATTASLPVHQSRRSPSRWDGPAPRPGIAWKPVVAAYLAGSGAIVFSDGSTLGPDDVDAVIYCTGYKPSFPFWNASSSAAGGSALYDHAEGRLVGAYWHTFFRGRQKNNLAVVGMPRVLTFRSFEYQAVALARLWSGRSTQGLPSEEAQERWETERAERTRRQGRRFHDISWDDGETMEWLEGLFRIAGLGTLKGDGRLPPALGEDVIWAVEHLKKYPEPGKGEGDGDGGEKTEKSVSESQVDEEDDGWVVVNRSVDVKDSLAFI